MHEWHTNTSRNPLSLIEEFVGYSFNTDYGGCQNVQCVKITNRVFDTVDKAGSYVREASYCSEMAYLAAYTTKKLTKAYQTAYDNFLAKNKDYMSFKNSLTLSYGRNASKVTCPNCGSSINLRYGDRFKKCPVCDSTKIISDSNWKILETKRKMREKAAENLSKEAEKNDVMFVCGIEWHC